MAARNAFASPRVHDLRQVDDGYPAVPGSGRMMPLGRSLSVGRGGPTLGEDERPGSDAERNRERLSSVPACHAMGAEQRRMATFSLRRGPDDAPCSPDGVVAASQYEGPHGPAFVGYSEDHLYTWVWGPRVPHVGLDYGPYGRLDGQRHGLLTASPASLVVLDWRGGTAPRWRRKPAFGTSRIAPSADA